MERQYTNIMDGRKDPTLLSISSAKPDICKGIISALVDLGISADVQSSKSVRCTNSSCRCWVENGCKVHIYEGNNGDIKDKVWRPLKARFGLGCAHISIPGGYSGCINSYDPTV
tara:strand:+ start:261 stop:602 length:342 start_codon:yes stop_codon:yes gene_type:complete